MGALYNPPSIRTRKAPLAQHERVRVRKLECSGITLFRRPHGSPELEGEPANELGRDRYARGEGGKPIATATVPARTEDGERAVEYAARLVRE